MRTLFLTLLVLLAIPTYVGAQQASPWIITGGGSHYLKPVTTLLGLMVPGLATSTTGCLSVSSSGWISASGSACGSGGSSSFSTTSASYFTSVGLAHSTTSADYWKTQRDFFSTTSANFYAGAGLAFSTTSANYWKSANDFFSTTSANYFSGAGLAFSTTSAAYFADASTTIAKLYKANTWSLLQTFSSGINVGGTTYTSLVPGTRALTVTGTASQIISSAGSQDLSADRTWTLSLPSHVIFPGTFQAGNATTTNATSTSLGVTNLVSCDTIDTDSTGSLRCGTDASSAGGGTFPFTPLTGYNATSTVIAFTAGIISNASSTLPYLGSGGVGVNNGLLYSGPTSTLSTISGSLALSQLAAQAAGTAIANQTSGSAVPTAVATSTFFGTPTPGTVLAFLSGSWQPAASTSVVAGTAITITTAGAATTINNTGVTSLVAGSGISVSGATGAVTVTNTIAFPWTQTTSWGANANSTSTLLLLTAGLTASSTIRFGNNGPLPLAFTMDTGNHLGLGSTTPSVLWGNSVGTTTIFGGAQYAGLYASSTGQAANYLVNWDTGNNQRVILNQTATLVINATSSNPRDGAKYTLKVCQDATGSRTATFVTPGQLVWLGGNRATTTVASAAYAATMIGLVYDARAQRYDVVASSTTNGTDTRSCNP